MGELIDVSMPLREGMPTWPGSPGASLRRLSTAGEDGAEATVSSLEMEIHTGTHLDAPMHMIAGAAGIEDQPLAAGIGPATVIDTGSEREIDAELLKRLDPPTDTGRILLRTANSRDPGLQRRPFARDYAALTLSGAEWLAERDIDLIGIDYLSIQRFDEPTETHRVLFRAGVAILEGLDLAAVEPGSYELLCLPLRLTGCEAAPARAVLRRLAADA